MKKILFAILVVLMLALTGCSSLNSIESIEAFIHENESLLTDAAVYSQFDSALVMPEIFNVYAERDCVVFTTGYSGLLTDTRSGFYYSFDGEPAGAGYANSWKLSPSGDGFAWRDSKGRIDYHTYPVFGNFYYFEGTW